MPARGRPARAKPAKPQAAKNKTRRGPGRAAGGKNKVKVGITIGLGVERVATSALQWSACKQCNRKFSVDELRVCCVELNDKGTPQTSKRWRHLTCFSSIKSKLIRRTAGEVQLAQVEGFSELGAVEQDSIRVLFKAMECRSTKDQPDIQGQGSAGFDGSCKEAVVVRLNHGAEQGHLEENQTNQQDRQDDGRDKSLTIEAIEEQESDPKVAASEQEQGQVLDDTILKAAKKLKLVPKLRSLTARPDICQAGVSATVVLNALTAANGSVVQARKALLAMMPVAQGAKRAACALTVAVSKEAKQRDLEEHTNQQDRPDDGCDKSLILEEMEEQECDPKVAASEQGQEQVLDGTVLKAAKKLKLVAKLRTLTARPDICQVGVSATVVLNALKDANGSLVQAKKALLGMTPVAQAAKRAACALQVAVSKEAKKMKVLPG